MLRTYTRILPVLAVAGAAGLLLVGPAWAAEVWVTNMKSANVQVIDPETMQVVAMILADKGAHNITLSKDGRLAFVANVGASNVTIIDAETKLVLGTVPAGKKAHDVSVSPDGKLAVASIPSP
jgi:YVTN family beta-propeller protein